MPAITFHDRVMPRTAPTYRDGHLGGLDNIIEDSVMVIEFRILSGQLAFSCDDPARTQVRGVPRWVVL